MTGHDIDDPDVVFDRLAKEAGAETFIPKSENGLQDALKAVSNLLESEYTLAYYPPKTSHKLRKIEVKVDRRDGRVLTSHFIVANPDAAELVHYVEDACLVSPTFHPYPYESDDGPMVFEIRLDGYRTVAVKSAHSVVGCCVTATWTGRRPEDRAMLPSTHDGVFPVCTKPAVHLCPPTPLRLGRR